MTTQRIVAVELFKGISITGHNQTGIVGKAFSASFSSRGGIPAITYAESGTLPASVTAAATGAGVTLTSSALTSSDAGTYSITISARDANRTRVTKTFQISIVALPLTISGHLAGGTTGTAASGSYTAGGGYPPYTFAVDSGTPPCTINSDGTVSGNWGFPTSYTWRTKVTDSLGNVAYIDDSCTVTALTLTLTGTYTATSTPTTAYSSDLLIGGGAAPYALGGTHGDGVISGTLPSGLSLSIVSSGGHYYLRLSGTTGATAPTYSFTVGITSADSQSATSAQSVTISTPVDATALSIYNKLKAGGSYFDMAAWTLVGGTHYETVDGANGYVVKNSSTTAPITGDGPGGSGDQTWQANSSTPYWTNNSTTNNDNTDVPTGIGSGASFTEFGWMRCASYSNDQNILARGESSFGNTASFELMSSSNTIYGFMQGTSKYVYLTPPTTNAWHFYVNVVDGSDNKMHMSIDAGTPAVSTMTVAPSGSSGFGIGAQYSGRGPVDSGTRLSKVGTVHDKLTSTEITWLYNSGAGRSWNDIKTLSGN